MKKKIAVIVANRHDFKDYLRSMDIHDMRAAYDIFAPVMSVNDCMGRDFLGVTIHSEPRDAGEVHQVALSRVR